MASTNAPMPMRLQRRSATTRDSCARLATSNAAPTSTIVTPSASQLARLAARSTTTSIKRASAPSTTRRVRLWGEMPPNAAAVSRTITGATMLGPPKVSAAYEGRSIGAANWPSSPHQSIHAVTTSTT